MRIPYLIQCVDDEHQTFNTVYKSRQFIHIDVPYAIMCLLGFSQQKDPCRILPDEIPNVSGIFPLIKPNFLRTLDHKPIKRTWADVPYYNLKDLLSLNYSQYNKAIIVDMDDYKRWKNGESIQNGSCNNANGVKLYSHSEIERLFKLNILGNGNDAYHTIIISTQNINKVTLDIFLKQLKLFADFGQPEKLRVFLDFKGAD